MKKVIFIGPYPPPYGGIASHLRDLLPPLRDKGYEVTSLTSAQRDKRELDHGMDNIYFCLKSFVHRNLLQVGFNLLKMWGCKKDLDFKTYLKNVATFCYIQKHIPKDEDCMVFVYDNSPCFVIPFLRKAFTDKLRLSAFIFGDLYLHPERYLAVPNFVKQVFSDANVVMASSCYCGDSVKTVMGLDYEAETIYVGVDCKLYHPELDRQRVRKQLGIPESAFVFLFLGRMDKSMGLDFVMKQAKQLLALGEDVYLVLAGAKGALTDEASQLAESDARIHSMINVPFDDKPYYYAACDIFLAPTIDKHACMGVSIKEAMAVGRPIVASSSGGIPEAIVNGETGYTIPFDENRQIDSEVFVSECQKLYSDTALREKFAKAGRQRALDVFSNEQSVAKYEVLLDKLATQGG